MQVICCVCQKTKNQNGWGKKMDGAGAKVSHGYCPRCLSDLLSRVDSFFAAQDCRKTA